MVDAASRTGGFLERHPRTENGLLQLARLASAGMLYLCQVGCLVAVGWFHYFLNGDRDAWLHVLLIDHPFACASGLFAFGGVAMLAGHVLGLLRPKPSVSTPESTEAPYADATDILHRAQAAARSDRPDLALAHELLAEAHRAGSAEAAYALANWHAHGVVVRRDRTVAFALLQEAAAAGVPAALHDVGVAYENGCETAVNAGRAYQSYLRAALFGHVEAMRAVSRCLDAGKGIPSDAEAAGTWWDAYLARGGKPGEAATGVWPWATPC